jgi:para-nitrobenzyl esterase
MQYRALARDRLGWAEHRSVRHSAPTANCVALHENVGIQFRDKFLKTVRLGLVLASVLAFGTWAAAGPVAVDGGSLQGVVADGVRVFKGIPFAAPPVGPLRWRAPQAAAGWSGIRAADRFSAVCPQHGSYPPESAPEPTSEDCLYLNIWTPLDPAAKSLPVMVWIYGGALENGSASTPLYAGDGFARRGVILVTINYRLGVLGFLALNSLSQESAAGVSGNYGLLDQIAALQWVRRNIGAFGGDAQRVTIFGQSSGSISVSALVASPLAKGLFQRAIGESGGLFEPLDLSPGFSLAGAEDNGRKFARRQGAPTLAELRAKSASDLLSTPFDAHFVVDGYVLKESPFDAYRAHAQNDVDVLVGTNADEGQLFLRKKSVTLANFKDILGADFPAPLVWLLHPNPGNTDSEARLAAAAIEGDMRFRWDMWRWARLAAENGGKHVYYYLFSRTPPFPSGNRYYGLGATHGMEMPYVFDHLDQQEVPWTTKDRELAAVLPEYWTNFAKYGDPNGPGLPVWPSFRESRDTVMFLGEQSRAEAIPGEQNLKRLDRIYAIAKFVSRHLYWMLALGIFAVAAFLVMLVMWYRRWARKRVERFATMHQLHA